MNALMNVSKNGYNKKLNTSRSWSNLIDELFDVSPFPTTLSRVGHGVRLPQVNIKETDDDYFVEMAIPGLKKEDITIDLDNEVLIISSEQKEDVAHTEGRYTRKEFGYSAFKRTFTLPESIDEGKIKATYESGILTVQLPKREEAKPKPARAITIS